MALGRIRACKGSERPLAVDKLTPQAAARLVPPLGRWRRFDEARAELMKGELTRIVSDPDLSKDVFEQASKSLG